MSSLSPKFDRTRKVGRSIASMKRKYFQCNCGGLAAELGFWALFSLFPFIIFVVAVGSLLPLAHPHEDALRALKRFVPDSVYAVIGPTVSNLLIQPNELIAVTTLLLALWAASRAVSSLMTALNRLYDLPETRPYWRAKFIALVLTMTTGMIYLLAFGLLVLGPLLTKQLIHHVGMKEAIKQLYHYSRLGIVAVAMTAVFCLIYKIGPNGGTARKPYLPGALVAMLGWFAVSAGFSYYIENIANFNRFYGTLGAVISLMTWLYLVGLMILIGGLVNAELASGARPRGG